MVISKSSISRAIAAVATVSAVAISPLLSTVAQAAITLNGAGATFPNPLYERYIAEIKKSPAMAGITVNYQSCGSSCGIRQTIAGTVDFGASDAPMSDDEISKVKNGVIMIPTAGGAVTIVYNVPGVTGLKLPRNVYPAIFSGQITRWNDSKITAANPGVNLPNAPIRLAVRADGSGTTFIFTNHLSAIDPYFRGRVGVGTRPNWAANPLKGRGNPGVAAQVQRTPNSIGYVELSYASQNNLNMAMLQNRSGEFVMPSLEAAKTALANIEYPDDFRVTADDPASGFPIVGLTWMMVYKQYDSAEKAAAVRKWMEWVLTEGQKINPTLNYVQLPEEVAQRALNKVKSEVKP